MRTGALLRTLVGHSGALTALAVARGGLIATGSEDGTVRLYRTEGRAEGRLKGLEEGLRSADVRIDPRFGLWDASQATIVPPSAGGGGQPKFELTPAPDGSIPGGPAGSAPSTTSTTR